MHPPHSKHSVSPLGLFVIETYSKRVVVFQTGAPRQTGLKRETKTDLTETSMRVPVPRQVAGPPANQQRKQVAMQQQR